MSPLLMRCLREIMVDLIFHKIMLIGGFLRNSKYRLYKEATLIFTLLVEGNTSVFEIVLQMV